MAVTHADLAPSRRKNRLSSKTGVFLIVLTILIGLFCFILSLVAETTRSESKWVISTGKDEKGKHECVYGGSGKASLLCSASAFVGLAIAVVLLHSYILIAISSTPLPPLVTWDPVSAPDKFLTFQAGLFFVTTWVCFAVGEVLLLIGVCVESGHLKKWSEPRESCLIAPEGLFTAAGVFALATVFLAAGLYLTVLRAQRIYMDLDNARRVVLQTSAFYASSPPRLPQQHMAATERENPIGRLGHNHSDQNLSLIFPTPSNKSSNLV